MPALALLLTALTLAVVSVARAEQTVRPGESVGALRSLADHYRRVAWEYQRAAHARRTPTSFSYRRSTDRDYLRWTIAAWTRRAYGARRARSARAPQRLAVQLPDAARAARAGSPAASPTAGG